MSDIAISGVIDGSDTKPVAIALHCSGSSGRQWSKLAARLAGRCALIAPDLIGCGANPL